MFGERLSLLRKQKKLSQYELANKLGYSRGKIANYEQGQREPDHATLKTIADFFEVSIDYLLGQTEDPSPGITVAGQDIFLSSEELEVFMEMKRNPKFAVMFHDLAKDPEKKVKTLIKMWEVIKADLEEDDDRDDIIED
jgi:transcriptional regulator with XRE-family HTH domain